VISLLLVLAQAAGAFQGAGKSLYRIRVERVGYHPGF